MSFDSGEIFDPSAVFYTEFRGSYPNSLFALIREHFSLYGSGRLLDVGCGSGQIAIPLSQHFEQVVAVDVSEEMVAVARQNVTASGLSNVEFVVLLGEDISSLARAGKFDLVTYGSSLHWMDIPKTFAASHDLLRDDGGIAILSMRSIWGGDSIWEQVVISVVRKWLGESRRAGASALFQPIIPFIQALADAGFSAIEEGKVEVEYCIGIPFIIGHLYSTSYANSGLFGDHITAFEHELTEALLALEPSGEFEWSPGAGYILARK
ncbi:MAG: class I SAM-dependent methyltransferase [Chloroflexi bacterium]|nr:class I SAM-dependent methyltransferase [Chloroflexota bacterium]